MPVEKDYLDSRLEVFSVKVESISEDLQGIKEKVREIEINNIDKKFLKETLGIFAGFITVLLFLFSMLGGYTLKGFKTELKDDIVNMLKKEMHTKPKNEEKNNER